MVAALKILAGVLVLLEHLLLEREHRRINAAGVAFMASGSAVERDDDTGSFHPYRGRIGT